MNQTKNIKWDFLLHFLLNFSRYIYISYTKITFLKIGVTIYNQHSKEGKEKEKRMELRIGEDYLCGTNNKWMMMRGGGPVLVMVMVVWVTSHGS